MRLKQAEDALLSHLRKHGSTAALGGSNRAIAEALGIDRSTLARAAAALARRGEIVVEAHKHGTRFALKRSAFLGLLRLYKLTFGRSWRNDRAKRARVRFSRFRKV
jgi:hypothetical protein